MIRIVCREVCLGPEGGEVSTRYKTFDLEHPALEALLAKERSYSSVCVVGAELISTPSTSGA